MRHLIILVALFMVACESKPKVIVEDETNNATPTQASESTPVVNSDMHQVTAIDVMQAEKYTYLQVVENADTMWIAASKLENAKKGNTYLYRGGLTKTNFHSQEFKRTFDKIVLVSNIIDGSAHPGNANHSQSETTNANTSDLKPLPGSVKLSDLFTKKASYKDKVIIVSGKVVKVNNAIMNRNWVHIQDGSKVDGKAADLTITTNASVKVGDNVGFEGKIILDKDFGAGYRYDIIMEEAVIKK